MERITHGGIADRIGSGLRLYFLTVTAPGERDHRRWVQGHIRGQHRPDCTCHDAWNEQTRGEWNAQESAHWNRLRTAIAREADVEFIGSVEVQDGKRNPGGKPRGLLHRHIVIASDVVLTHTQVQRAALSAGYGCVLDLEPLQSPEKASRYIAKYVTKSAGLRGEVAWSKETLNRHTGELITSSAPTFRTWSSSQRWGHTIKGLKAVQREQARARARYLREYDEAVQLEASAAAVAGSASPPASSDPPP